MVASSRRRGFRRFHILVITVSALTVWAAGASVASADVGPGASCAHGYYPVSVGCVNSQNNEVYYGGYDNFDNVGLVAAGASTSNPTPHTNQEMWFYTQPDDAQWVETGIRQGYWVPCACVTYATFWAEFDTSNNEYRHTISYSSADGSNHSYEIQQDSSTPNYWDVYYDYNLVGTATYQLNDAGYEIMHGLETSEVDSNTSSDIANHSPLEYEDSSGAWVYDPYEQSWVDYPCSPPSSTGSNCLTGYGNGSDVWYAGKGS